MIAGVARTIREANRAFAVDREHAALLTDIAPETFSILHRIDLHVFGFSASEATGA